MPNLPFMPTFRGPYPPGMSRVCAQCPFGRDPWRAWPARPEGVLRLAEAGDGWLCHMSATEFMGGDDPGARQCRGMAIFRLKAGWLPRHPDDLAHAISGWLDPDWDLVMSIEEARTKWHLNETLDNLSDKS